MTEQLTAERFQPAEGDSQVEEWYKKLMLQIIEIDEKLDAGLDSTGKRKITNDLIESSEPTWKPVVDHLVTQMANMPEEKLAGVFYAIVRNLSSAYKENVDTYIGKLYESQPKSAEAEVSDEEKAALQEARRELASKVKPLLEMAETFGEFTADNPWPAPKRRGAVGKRGKRALTLYTWTVDGAEMDEDNDSVKGVSEFLGFEKSSEFTKALKDKGINTTSPDDEFTVQINGKEVSGRRLTEEDEVEEASEPGADDE